ncbi:MAG: MBL fold metallo-hydrolase [Saprospiraceae bacterium]|nr:MBL fold metallo-hydrolase [Saprospiraceae bacterium]
MLKGQTDITWFPNSWIRLRTNKKVIYFDPAYLTTYFTNYHDKTEFSKWPGPIDGLPNNLEKADIICITHHHKDHCKKVTTDRLRKKETKVFAPKSCLPELRDSFQVVKIGDRFKIDKDIKLEVVDAYNTVDGSSTRKQHKKGKGCGYVMTLGKLRVYHLGDTDYLPEMKNLKNIDIAFVPMGGKFTMDANEALEATKAISPKIVIPVHKLDKDFGDFAKGLKGNKIKCLVPEIGKPIII